MHFLVKFVVYYVQFILGIRMSWFGQVGLQSALDELLVKFVAAIS